VINDYKALRFIQKEEAQAKEGRGTGQRRKRHRPKNPNGLNLESFEES
jgi:hypothetical protein